MASGPPRSGLTPKPVELRGVSLATPVVLAPMAGVTDQAFRRLCREFAVKGLPDREQASQDDGRIASAGLFISEMITARALLAGNARSWTMVAPDGHEQVKSIQLYGTDPDSLGEAAALLVDRGFADHIDLNFGCPAPKVTRKGGGAAIPWKKDLFSSIVDSVVTSVDRASHGAVPVTIKMRVGIDEDHITAFDAARTAQSLGVSAIGLHARTHTQYYSGAANWQWITRLKEEVAIPVFGNGDVFGAEDALVMMEETGCDGVIVGRGCQGRPWLFEEINAALWGLDAPAAPDLGEIADTLLQHASYAVTAGNEGRVIKSLRKHIGWYLRGFAIGGEAKRRLQLVSTYEELAAALADLDLDQPFPAAGFGSRGRAGSPRVPHLPHGWLDSRTLTAEQSGMLVHAEHDISGG